MAFRVTNIIDGNTIQVNGWKWGDKHSGTKVRISGYQIDPAYSNLAKSRLTTLLSGKEVELKNPTSTIKGTTDGEELLVCEVYLNDIDVSKYFPELKHT